MRCVPGLSAIVAIALVGLVVGSRSAAVAQDATPEPAPRSTEAVLIETLAATTELPFRPRGATASLARYTYEPGASIELPATGAVLVYVETGALALGALGPRASILLPEEEIEIETPEAGEATPTDDSIIIGAGGSAYAPEGGLGLTRNVGNGPLVLLVVAFVTSPDAPAATVGAPSQPTVTMPAIISGVSQPTPTPAAATPAPTATQTATPEPTAAPTGISVGATVSINAEGINLRAAPGLTAAVVAVLAQGTVLTVTGPSESVDDLVWWPVVVAETGQSGYVAETLLTPAA